MTTEELDALAGLLIPDDPGEWIEHDGGGRPHPSSFYVQVQTRNGSTLNVDSACIPWVWGSDGEGLDIMRWRQRKRPPSDKQLAAYLPALIAEVRQGRERVAVLTARLDEIERSKWGYMPDDGETTFETLAEWADEHLSEGETTYEQFNWCGHLGKTWATFEWIPNLDNFLITEHKTEAEAKAALAALTGEREG